jgi:homospermidine synthase
MPFYEIYKEDEVVASGEDRNGVMAYARTLYPDAHLIGVCYQAKDAPYGNFTGFFVSNAPIALGM